MLFRMHVAARWSSGQDEGLSRLNREFDSPTGHHQTCPRRLSAGIGTFFRRPAADTARRGKRANQRIARIAQRASKSTIERVEGTAENSPRTARGTCCKPIQYAYLAQSVEHAAVNRRVVGSSPTVGASQKSMKTTVFRAFDP